MEKNEKKVILIVDDNITNLEIARMALEDEYNVFLIPSATKALKSVSKILPDLILLDVEMPEMNGFQVISQLKSMGAPIADVPVIFVTVMNDNSSEFEGLNLGACDYISKPFCFSLLKKRVEIHLKMVEQQKELQNYSENLEQMVAESIQKTKEIQKEYSAQSQYFMAMQELSEDDLFRIDSATHTYYYSDKSVEGFRNAMSIPDYIESFVSRGAVPSEDIAEFREKNLALLSDKITEFEIRAKEPESGEFQWYEVKGKCIYDETGKPIEVFGTIENVQWKKDLEQRASHDLMTKILNKVSFESEVAEILEKSPEGKQHALIFIDLDDFKGINDTLGHSFGDLLLTTVGKRLKRVVRKSDLVGRIGGDEFAVFLQNIDCDDSALMRTNLLLDTLRRQFSFEGNSREIKSSMGIAIFPKHGSNYRELIAKSDLALYESKRNGKNLVTLYTDLAE